MAAVEAANTEPCPGCGHGGGAAECRSAFEEMLARDYGDPLFFGCHRLFVDAYCLQHPERHCVSAKSLAAHLAGLCQILEDGASEATGSDCLQRWLSGAPALEKPALPPGRGALTLADLAGIDDPAAWRKAVREWAESVWEAYAELHPIARSWSSRARAASR
jgi:hypothetical protein